MGTVVACWPVVLMLWLPAVQGAGRSVSAAQWTVRLCFVGVRQLWPQAVQGASRTVCGAVDWSAVSTYRILPPQAQVWHSLQDFRHKPCAQLGTGSQSLGGVRQ